MGNFLITLLGGCFGLHKFLSGKIGMGLLYLCTFGLFGFGWLYDCFVAFKNIGKKPEPPKSTAAVPLSSANAIDMVVKNIDPELCHYTLNMIKAGVEHQRIVSAYMQTHPKEERADVLERVRYIAAYYSSLEELSGLSDAGISKYQILVACDDQLCPLCKEQGGKIYRVKSAKIGYNCPPFHRGCRCCIVAHFE